MEELRIFEKDTIQYQWRSVCTTCERCWVKVQDILDWEICRDSQCDKSIIFQAQLIESSWIDPFTWILQYAEKFRVLWNEWKTEWEIIQRLYN